MSTSGQASPACGDRMGRSRMIGAGATAGLHQLWSLTFREAQTQAFADAFLAIMVCLIAAMALIPLMQKVAPPSAPPPADAH
jgi:DHA2 family multidrug resistance protein